MSGQAWEKPCLCYTELQIFSEIIESFKFIIIFVRFYLLNLGFALVIMEITNEISDSRSMLEILSTKIGGFSIYLGIMLFFNMYLFFPGRRISKQKARMAEAYSKVTAGGKQY